MYHCCSDHSSLFSLFISRHIHASQDTLAQTVKQYQPASISHTHTRSPLPPTAHMYQSHPMTPVSAHTLLPETWASSTHRKHHSRFHRQSSSSSEVISHSSLSRVRDIDLGGGRAPIATFFIFGFKKLPFKSCQLSRFLSKDE